MGYTIPYMEPIDLTAVNILIKVSQVSSFRGAAEALGIPKTTVSRKIVELEARLGVQLLKRTTRQVSLTEAGHTFVEAAYLALSDLEAAEEAVSRSQKEPSGRIRITAPGPLGQMYIAGLIASFLIKYPKIEVQLHLSYRQVDLLKDKFDVAIRFGSLPDSTLVATQIATTSQCLVASPNYLKRSGEPKKLSDLSNHDCILFGNEALSLHSTWVLHSKKRKTKVRVKGRFVTDDLLSLRSAAVNDLGIALLPEPLIKKEIQSGQLVSVLKDYSTETVPLNIIHTGGPFIPHRIRLFIDYAVENFRNQKSRKL
jgi:DNA-binding transcriptional LysR family regulator